MFPAGNRKPSGRTPIGVECSRGAAIGAANGALLAVFAGAALPVVVIASAGASAVGALIALLVWSGSSEAPEDPVLPPSNDS